MDNIPQRDLYFLWSVERVGVLYDLPTIGRKDWYRWGAEMLVANQKPQGNWADGGYPGTNLVIDTCLALLFLKRGNLVADLTTKLPFDPKALTASINEQIAPALPADSATDHTLKTAAPPAAPPAEPQGPPAKVATEARTTPQTESAPSEDSETRGQRGWLWLLVLLAVVLFIACGVLLSSYSLSRRKRRERFRARRHAKDRPRRPPGSAKPSRR